MKISIRSLCPCRYPAYTQIKPSSDVGVCLGCSSPTSISNQGWLWGSEFVFKDETLMLLTRLSFPSRTHLRSFLSQKAACSRACRDFRFLWQRFHFKDCWDVAQRGVQSPLCGAQAVKLFVWELLLKHSGPGLQRTPGVLLARQRSHHPSCSDGSSFFRHLSLAQGGCPQLKEAPRGI